MKLVSIIIIILAWASTIMAFSGLAYESIHLSFISIVVLLVAMIIMRIFHKGV